MLSQEMKERIEKQGWAVLDAMLDELDAGGMDCSYAGTNYVSARENASQKIVQIVEKILEEKAEAIKKMKFKNTTDEEAHYNLGLKDAIDILLN